MSKFQSFRKGQIVAISALFAATFGFFGCGDDSSSGGDSNSSANAPTCTVSKSSNTVTVKESEDGVNTTTVYVFKDGKMKSMSQVITMPEETNAAAKATCKAMDQDEEGVEVEFEDGACTITTTKGLEGTLDKTYKAMLTMCENVKENGKSSEEEEKDEPSKTIADLTKLYTTKCAKANANEVVAVKGESNNYICAAIDLGIGELTYMWAPVVDDIDDMPKCTKKWATANPKLTYAFDKSDETIYTCTQDEESKWAWTALKVEDKKGKDGDDEDDESGDDEGDDENGDDENEESGDDEGDEEDNGSSSSANKAKSSSSSAKASDKSVTFKDDVIWDPSYASRARTFFNTVGEDNFLADNEVTGDSSGWWFKYLDDADFGTSTAVGKFTDATLNLTITLNYKDWHLVGSSSEGYLAPDPYPYAGFGFSWSPNGEAESVDLSDWEGICMIYDATDYFEVAFQAEGDGGLSYYYLASPSSSTKTINIAFSSLDRSIYAKTDLTKAEALKHATSFQIKYTNDETDGIEYYCNRLYGDTAARCNSSNISASNTINIYKIGKYGTCSGVSTTL